MIETPVSNTARMARLLTSVNYWAVTGTPIGKNDLEDLYGLMLFLEIFPFTSRTVWKRLCGLHIADFDQIIQKYMLRNTKESVKTEVILPPQTHTTYYLDFSAVEQHFYDQLWEEAGRRIHNQNDDIASWLLSLRQIW